MRPLTQLHEVPPHRFLMLLLSMVSIILVPAYIDFAAHSGAVFKLMFHLLLLTSLYLVAERVKVLLIGVLLSLPWKQLKKSMISSPCPNSAYLIGWS